MFDISEYDKISDFIKEDFENNYSAVKSCNCSGDIRSLVVNNHPFVIVFHRDHISIWANNGSTCLKGVSKYNYKDGISDKEIRELYSSIKNYLDGFINCDDCGKLIKRSEIAGSFFAGVYCKDCWERYWKKRESEENYE